MSFAENAVFRGPPLTYRIQVIPAQTTQGGDRICPLFTLYNDCSTNVWFSVCGSRTNSISIHRKPAGNEHFKPCPRRTESEAIGVGLRHQCVLSFSEFWCESLGTTALRHQGFAASRPFYIHSLPPILFILSSVIFLIRYEPDYLCKREMLPLSVFFLLFFFTLCFLLESFY